MKRSLLLLTILISVASTPHRLRGDGVGDDISVSLVAATSISDSLPQNVLIGNKWKAEPHAEYVKLHIYLDEPIVLRGIEVESCNGPFREKPAAYVNFDQIYLPLKGETETVSNEIDNFETRSPARSVTINFGRSNNLCIRWVRLLDKNNLPYAVRVPDTVDATVAATTTLSPVQSYDIMNLFDSRMENGWSSKGRVSGDEIKFKFASTKKVTKIRLWNGYQRSDQHCFQNSRVKTFEITGDGNYKATVSVRDIMGYQDLKLPKPFSGKHLTLKIANGYPGKSYRDLVISELRFFDGSNWFMPDPLARLKQIAKSNQSRFKKAGFQELLDKTIRSEAGSSGLTFRLRSDGSFFLEGSSLNYSEGTETSYYALGNYEIKPGENNALQLRIFGYLRKNVYEYSMDCNGCGKDCNLQNRGNAASPGQTEGIFQEFIALKKKGESYSLENTGKRQRIRFEPGFNYVLDSISE